MSTCKSPLRRLGRKDPKKYLPYFPERVTTFIDMFMGSGAITFAMLDKARYIFANDNDYEVFNFFQVVREHQEELVSCIKKTPLHGELFKYWNHTTEETPVWQATRFFVLSQYGYIGQPSSFAYKPGNDKTALFASVQQLSEVVASNSIQYLCCDFRDVLKSICWRDRKEQRDAFVNAFIYADPPYLETGNNYAESFTEDDSADLFEILVNSGIRFAMSEFDHPFILKKAKEYSLYITEIGERRNLKNRRTEILVTNYEPIQKWKQTTLTEYLEQIA